MGGIVNVQGATRGAVNGLDPQPDCTDLFVIAGVVFDAAGSGADAIVGDRFEYSTA